MYANLNKELNLKDLVEKINENIINKDIKEELVIKELEKDIISIKTLSSSLTKEKFNS